MAGNELALRPNGTLPCRFDPDGEGQVAAGEILAETDVAYLTQAMVRREGQGFVLDPDHYLILPKEHIGRRQDLPDGWSVHECAMLSAIPGFGPDEDTWPPYVVYYLSGLQVGQTIWHLHGHVRVDQLPTGWMPAPVA